MSIPRTFALAVAAAGILAVAGCGAQPTDEGTQTPESTYSYTDEPTPEDTEALTQSDNEKYPPPQDIVKYSCKRVDDGLGGFDLRLDMTVTNHSPKASSYSITFEVVSGTTRLGTDTEYVDTLRAGQTAVANNPYVGSYPAGAKCVLLSVDRTSAEG